jgi:hypothetical protein
MRRPYSTALELRIAESFRFCFSADKEIHPGVSIPIINPTIHCRREFPVFANAIDV